MQEIMSTAQRFSEKGRLRCRRPAKSPEKSSFSHTCSLFSQYVKEKGTFGELGLGMTCHLDRKGKFEAFRPTATMNLLPKIERASEEVSERKESVSGCNVESMDLFPQHAGVRLGPSEDSLKRSDLSSHPSEPKTGRMTIFYAGKVIVFDDFPSDKAEELMLMAINGVPQNSGDQCGTFPLNNPSVSSANCNNPQANPPFNHLRQQPQAHASDLPIARKVSLHRFLEKRKARISLKAPYQLHREESAAPVKPPTRRESKSCRGLACRHLCTITDF